MPNDMAFTHCGECGSTLLICSRRDCGKTFPRRPHEDETSWGSRRYCSLECAAAERQQLRFEGRVLAEKACGNPECEKLATQRRNETPRSFELRKYCSHECANAVRRQSAPEKLEHRKELRHAREQVKSDSSELPPEKPPVVPVERYVPAPVPELPPAPVVASRPTWRPGLWRELDEARR